ncbi:MAG: thiol-activated cytolysin family protein [Prevotella sp.]|jgi:thiol-activated cytolysin
MSKKLSFSLTMLAALAMLGTTSCSNDLETMGNQDESVVEGKENVQNYMASLSKPAGVIPVDDSESEDDEGTPVVIGSDESEVGSLTELNGIPGRWITTTRKYRLDASFNDAVLLNPASDIIYPGCAIKGSSIADGTYAILSGCETGPITFNVDLQAANPADQASMKATIMNIRKSDYQQALAQMLNIHCEEPGVVTTASVEKVNNEKEFLAKLGAVVKGGDFSVGGSLNLNFDSKRTYVVAKCIQKFFTVSMDAPETETIFTKVDKKYLDDVQPMYVSNISYGRILFFTLSTEDNSQHVQAALQYAMSKIEGTPISVEPELEVEYNKILKSSDISVTVLGGNKEYQNEVINGGLDAMQRFMEGHLPLSQMVPVSFSLRYAIDNSLARIQTSNEYTVAERVFMPDFQRVDFRFHVEGFSGYNSISGKPLDQNSVIAGNVWVEANGNRENIYVIDKNHPFSFEYRSGDWQIHPVNIQTHVLQFQRSANEEIKEFLNNTMITFGSTMDHVGYLGSSYGEAFTTLALDQIYSIYQSGDQHFMIESNDGGTRTLRTFIKIDDMEFFNTQGKKISIRR